VDRIVKKGTGVRTVWPRRDAQTPETQNVFRLLPVIDPETRTLVPYRLSMEPHDFGLWLFPVHVANIGGVRGTAFITADTRNQPGADAQTLYGTLYARVLEAAQKAKPQWRAMNLVRVPGSDSIPLMMEPDLKYLAMCCVASHADYPLRGRLYGADPEEQLFVLVMTRIAAFRLQDRLETPGNISLDIIDLRGGAFVHIHQHRDPNARGYDATVLRNYGGMEPRVPPTVASKLCWWDDILHFPDPTEQINILHSCGVPADVLVYGLTGTPYEIYLPESIRAAADGAEPVAISPAPGVDPLRNGRPSVATTPTPPPFDPAVFTSSLDIPDEYRKALEEAEARRRKQ
jgi:hypothetical protein